MTGKNYRVTHAKVGNQHGYRLPNADRQEILAKFKRRAAE